MFSSMTNPHVVFLPIKIAVIKKKQLLCSNAGSDRELMGGNKPDHKIFCQHFSFYCSSHLTVSSSADKHKHLIKTQLLSSHSSCFLYMDCVGRNS